jgi:hypothetical protein
LLPKRRAELEETDIRSVPGIRVERRLALGDGPEGRRGNAVRGGGDAEGVIDARSDRRPIAGSQRPYHLAVPAAFRGELSAQRVDLSAQRVDLTLGCGERRVLGLGAPDLGRGQGCGAGADDQRGRCDDDDGACQSFSRVGFSPVVRRAAVVRWVTREAGGRAGLRPDVAQAGRTVVDDESGRFSV